MITVKRIISTEHVKQNRRAHRMNQILPNPQLGAVPTRGIDIYHISHFLANKFKMFSLVNK